MERDRIQLVYAWVWKHEKEVLSDALRSPANVAWFLVVPDRSHVWGWEFLRVFPTPQAPTRPMENTLSEVEKKPRMEEGTAFANPVGTGVGPILFGRALHILF